MWRMAFVPVFLNITSQNSGALALVNLPLYYKSASLIIDNSNPDFTNDLVCNTKY